jgi:hypothetical protein
MITAKAENALAEVWHFDLYGELDNKNKLSTIPFAKLKPTSPEYFFVPKNYDVKTSMKKDLAYRNYFL